MSIAVQKQLICRTCMTKDTPLVSIFDSLCANNLKTRIKDVLPLCASVQIYEEDGLPDGLCIPCTGELKQAYLFRLKCEESECTLKSELNFIKQEPQTSNDDGTCEEPEQFFVNFVKLDPEEPKTELLNNTGSPGKNSKFGVEQEQVQDYEGDKFLGERCAPTKGTKRTGAAEVPPLIWLQTERNIEHSQDFADQSSESNVSEDETKIILDNTDTIPEFVGVSSYGISTKSNRNVTEIETTPDLPNSCAKCKLTFETDVLLRKHEATHTDEETFKCNVCSKKFSCKVKFMHHLLLHTGVVHADPDKTNSGKKSYPCNICGKRYSEAGSVEYHKNSVHANKEAYKCDVCGKKLSRKDRLKHHMMLHTGEVGEFACKVCGKKFLTYNRQVNHEKTHSDEKPYLCNICGKRYPATQSLDYHMTTHTGLKPYKCVHCGKHFSSHSALYTHTLIHTDTKSYKCETCGKLFSTRNNLSSHKVIHGKEKLFKCDLCNKRFHFSSMLGKHRRTHTGEKPYECKECGDRFACSSILKNHMRTHTGEKPYVCELCGQAFRQAGTLGTHRKRVHKLGRDA